MVLSGGTGAGSRLARHAWIVTDVPAVAAIVPIRLHVDAFVESARLATHLSRGTDFRSTTQTVFDVSRNETREKRSTAGPTFAKSVRRFLATFGDTATSVRILAAGRSHGPFGRLARRGQAERTSDQPLEYLTP